jgi:hypothetical protein
MQVDDRAGLIQDCGSQILHSVNNCSAPILRSFRNCFAFRYG